MDRHKLPPLSLRLPAGDRTWLAAYAAETGRPVNAIVTEALALHRKRIEARDRRILRESAELRAGVQR